MTKIAAIIVTYNRSSLLIKALNSINSQTRTPDIIYVVNNASTDNTKEVIDFHGKHSRVPMNIVDLEFNTGGAGGFCCGLEKAYENGFDYFWLMDDDTIPKADALEMLELDILKYEEENLLKPPFACSTVLWKDDEVCLMNIPRPSQYWTSNLHKSSGVALIDSCSFVSVLVTKEAVQKSGLPIPEFFIWYDDVEFTNRLSRDSRPGILSTRSKVNHLLAENKGTESDAINENNIWKHSYGVRNEGFVIIRDRGIFHFAYFALRKFELYLKLKISYKYKLKLIKSCISALFFRPKIRHPIKKSTKQPD